MAPTEERDGVDQSQAVTHISISLAGLGHTNQSPGKMMPKPGELSAQEDLCILVNIIAYFFQKVFFLSLKPIALLVFCPNLLHNQAVGKRCAKDSLHLQSQLNHMALLPHQHAPLCKVHMKIWTDRLTKMVVDLLV